ncbi:MAG: [ribosomal protein S18]-alanine N-acetyltransferase [Methanolobus sp.]|uniref:Ribosomal-protein-alanine acetyltransferase n=1 Tax=Methanolobus tindarius DSM 2278 TaxID=1090322 RepID=W9DQX9_METTI|nr:MULTISPECIES: ribosomal protein S18-alanine N-acetyltransferase [Methanolobus]ETA67855.1 ribosomal-protein-alanine acetyltransferase [Methanolobus tindarius DSM 2278]MDI3484884.1 [ribosomal protein S18]-alanine N-acetyltransferase [Methanolobus sp.]MDK2831258.1 [ribosomal protein S18]-alanine N-acetyltransferase [Methanolobus sp.]MDK2939505.1 [ribosomal protein S18]-alanine N-acetyltransferase [Methanolobus sp.]
MKDVVIRRAELSDIPRIVEIEDCSFEVPWPDFLFKAHLSNPGFLVYEKEQILGYVIIGTSEDRTRSHLQSIAVHKDCRRQGIASKLLNWCIDLAKLYGFERMTLEVREKNIDAQLFYSENGFKVEGRIDGYYVDDNAIVMCRDI